MRSEQQCCVYLHLYIPIVNHANMPPVMRYTYNPSYGPRIITDPITGFPIASLLAYVLYILYPFTPNTTQQQGPPRPSLQNIHTYCTHLRQLNRRPTCTCPSLRARPKPRPLHHHDPRSEFPKCAS